MEVFVQLADATEGAPVISVFGCSQDPDVYSNQAVLQATDPRYIAYLQEHPILITAGFPNPEHS
jgi:hypothetical protein